jgi:hypothetical protein
MVEMFGDLDKWISKLKQRELIEESEIKVLCLRATEILGSEPNLVEVEAPVAVVGDIKGDFESL